MRNLNTEAPRTRWLVFIILGSAYFISFFHRLCPAVVALDMMKDLGTGETLLGFLGSAYFYPYFLMQLPAGLLADSWGPRRTISVFTLLAFAGSILLGAAPTVEWAVAGRTMVGAGVSMILVPSLKVLSRWFKDHEFATATGLLMAMGGLGSVGAAGPLAWVSGRLGWRLSFIVVGVITLLISALVWGIVRDRPGNPGSPVGETPDRNVEPRIPLAKGAWQVLTRMEFWPLALWFACEGAILFSFTGLWGGPYLMEVHGLTKNEAGRVLSMAGFGMIAGAPLQSFLSDRVFRSRKIVLILASVVVCAMVSALAYRTGTLPLAALYLICLGIGIFLSGVAVVAFAATKELFPLSIVGTATGLVNIFPFAATAVLQPLMGYFLEFHKASGGSPTQGYQSAFHLLFLCGIGLCASSLFIRETIGSRRTRESV